MTMITFDKFEKIINNIQDFNCCMDKLYDLKIDLFESDLVSKYTELFEETLDFYFTEEGVDCIYWWLYEDVEKVIDDINIKTAKDLYDYLISDECYVK